MSDHPKVLHVTITTRVQYVLEVLRSVQNAGCLVELVCPIEGEYDAVVEPSKILSPGSVTVKRFGFKFGLLYWPFVAARALRSMPRKAPVAHLNWPCHELFASWFINRLCRLGYEVIYTVHDPIPHKWMGKVSKLRPMYWFLKASYTAPQAIIVHDDRGKDFLAKHFQISSHKIHVIPHIAFKMADTIDEYSIQPEFVALLFGQIRANKGIDLAICAVQELRARGLPIRLIIAGNCRGEANLRAWELCKALIAKNADGIEVIDRYISNDELPALLGRTHMLLMPYTEFYSSSGVASLALSNGRALVATGVGGLAEIVTHKEAVIEISAPTVEAVKDALLQALDEGHDGLRNRGLAGKRIAEDNFGSDTVGRQHRSLYEKLSGPQRGECRDLNSPVFDKN